jgi:hypothetical protein
LLLDAIVFHQDDLVQQCVEFLASHFLHMNVVMMEDEKEDEKCAEELISPRELFTNDEIRTPNINKLPQLSNDMNGFEQLPLSLVLRLLTHPRLSVGDEWPLYILICRYIEHNHDQLTSDDIDALFQTVRFRWFSYQQLCHALRNRRVPRYLLIEACLARLQSLEQPTPLVITSLPPPPPPRLQRRRWRGVSFDHQPPTLSTTQQQQQNRTESTLVSLSPPHSPSSSSSSSSSPPPSSNFVLQRTLNVLTERNDFSSSFAESGGHFSPQPQQKCVPTPYNDDSTDDDNTNAKLDDDDFLSFDSEREMDERSESEEEQQSDLSTTRVQFVQSPRISAPTSRQPPRGILWWLGTDFSPLPSETWNTNSTSSSSTSSIHATTQPVSERRILYRKRCWMNPCLLGRVRVTASSVERGELHQLVDWGWENNEPPHQLWTKDVPSSWFAVDLLHFQVLPRAYALRHGGNYKADSLRTWDFQGSNDGRTWTVIRRHTNDESLNGPFATATFEVHTTQRFRCFRILQTGHNSSNHNFLVLSGLELYGDLWEIEDASPSLPHESVS